LIADIRQLLIDVQKALESAAVPYALIGGCARNAYAEPRATKDVDMVVAGDVTSYAALEHALRLGGFTRASAVQAPDDSVPDLVLYRDASGRRVDVLFAKTEFERSALARREWRASYDSIRLPIVTPEDLVIYKLIAGRTQDWADVEQVLLALAIEARSFDWEYVEAWCREWDIADRGARARSLTH
jgi:hypothetical protein